MGWALRSHAVWLRPENQSSSQVETWKEVHICDSTDCMFFVLFVFSVARRLEEVVNYSGSNHSNSHNPHLLKALQVVQCSYGNSGQDLLPKHFKYHFTTLDNQNTSSLNAFDSLFILRHCQAADDRIPDFQSKWTPCTVANMTQWISVDTVYMSTEVVMS